MNALLAFRLCVVAEVTTLLLYIALCYLPESNETWSTLLEWNYQGSVFSWAHSLAPNVFQPWTWTAVWYAVLAVHIAASIGMLFLQNWARIIFLGITFYYIAQIPLSGLSVIRPYEVFIGTFSWMLSGAVIVLACMPPVSKLFTRKATATAQSIPAE